FREAAAVRADVADPAPRAAQRRPCTRRPDGRAGRPADPGARAADDRRDLRAPVSEYVVVGAGAIGGTLGAKLARGGHSGLSCDADPEQVAAITARGLAIEGPVAAFTVNARAVSPGELPDGLGAVLLAVKSQHTEDALAEITPRLAADGFVVSLQNGVNEPAIAATVGEERTVGAFVNFGADYLEPGRIFLGGRGALYVGELDGSRSPRPRPPPP